MARNHTAGVVKVARDAGAKEILLALYAPRTVFNGFTPAGNRRYKVNPGTRILDSAKALYAAIIKADVVVPDPVRHETVPQILAVRQRFRQEMAGEGHVANVAGTVELWTKESLKVAIEMLLLPTNDLPIVAVLPRGSRGWDMLRALMRNVNDLREAGIHVPDGKRIIVYGNRKTAPDTDASFAVLALCGGITDIVHAMPRMYVPDEDDEPRDPAEIALDRMIYRTTRGSYAQAAQATKSPQEFGPTADLIKLLPGQPDWTLEKARDEGYRLEVIGTHADWLRAKPMTADERRQAFPDLAPYLW